MGTLHAEGRNLPSKVTVKATVMVRLSVETVTEMFLDPFATVALFVPGIYLVGVPSKVMTEKHGILFSSIVLKITCKYNASIYVRMGSDILTKQ